MKLTYSTPKSHFCLLSLVFRFQGRHFEEHQGEHRKYHGLDKPDKHFEEHKRQWQKVRYQVEHDGEEHLPGKDVSKETKGERDNLAYFGHELKDTNGGPNTIGLVERTDKKLLAVLHDTESSDTGKLDRHHRDE